MDRLNLKQKISLGVFGFLAASLGGWIYEEICIYILYHHIYNRGMLHLPICPIYGFGAWGLWLLLRRVKNTGAFFALSVITASAFEFGCSYLLELLFHRSYWTYEGWPLSVDNRISLVSSMIFGLLAVIFAKMILPPLTRSIKKGSEKIWFISSIAALLIVGGDFLLVLRGM